MSQRRELAHRAAGGLEVRLVWNPVTDELTVSVCDRRCGAYFELRPPHDSVLDVYYHPYLYAALTAMQGGDDLLAA